MSSREKSGRSSFQVCSLNPKLTEDLHPGCFCLLLWMDCPFNPTAVHLCSKAHHTAAVLNSYRGRAFTEPQSQQEPAVFQSSLSKGLPGEMLTMG